VSVPVPIVPIPPIPPDACPKGASAAAQMEGPQPLERLAPSYPTKAASAGIQGWVCIRYTITPAGGVKDVEVLAAAPQGYDFENAALVAVSSWKFEARPGPQPKRPQPYTAMLKFMFER
jgi:TonB family protein